MRVWVWVGLYVVVTVNSWRLQKAILEMSRIGACKMEMS